MPRKWFELVRAWPELQAGTDYVVRCRAVTKCTDPPGIEAVLEFLKDDQAGRTIEVVLALPILPIGPTRSFLEAADLEVAVGQKVAPEDAVGAVMIVRFDTDPAGGRLRPVQFTSNSDRGDRNKAEIASP